MATQQELYKGLPEHLEAIKAHIGHLEEHIQTLMASEPVEAVAGAAGSNLGLTLFVFALAIFLGVELITKVPSQLHTPLMSGSNAISGITIVGALIALQNVPSNSPMVIVLGTLAVITASINVVGGYLVTDRMLGMFKSKSKQEG
jgi:NAD(P) transhydrogenase subunit alpha